MTFFIIAMVQLLLASSSQQCMFVILILLSHLNPDQFRRLYGGTSSCSISWMYSHYLIPFSSFLFSDFVLLWNLSGRHLAYQTYSKEVELDFIFTAILNHV